MVRCNPKDVAVIAIEPVSVQDYVREVLPQTHALWGDGRSYERYVEDFRTVATSAYARRRNFTLGLRDGDVLACSCKNYDREVRYENGALSATGIGAVFTRSALRGRGYASAMLGALLDAERDAGRDLAFLYSDIHPAFYEKLGFVALPSRAMTVRAGLLDGSPAGAAPLETRDWPAVRRCFEALDAERAWSLRRTPLVWDWMRDRWNAPVSDGSQPVRLVVRRGRGVIAYAFGRRIPRRDTFALDEYAFDGPEGRRLVPALLRAGAGDLRRIGGWLPPAPARDVLPRTSVRARKSAVLMVVPLSAAARSWWLACKAATLASRADATWSSDHI